MCVFQISEYCNHVLIT